MTTVDKTPKPFSISIPQSRLDLLHRKLDDADLPTEPLLPGASWDYGTDTVKLKKLVEVWRAGGWDWRIVEGRMNRFKHFIVTLPTPPPHPLSKSAGSSPADVPSDETVDVHFIHQRSHRSDAVPLILCHGWPGSFAEFLHIIEPLTNPPEGQQAFHVVVPSLLGYGFSSRPPRKGWDLVDTAAVLHTLMTDILGYPTYAAHGGDWGTAVTKSLATYPECRAYHLTLWVPQPPFPFNVAVALFPAWLTEKAIGWSFDEFERFGLLRALEYVKSGSGYYEIQSTKPSTIGLALYDSPVSILAYLLEKFQLWVDPRAPAFNQDSPTAESSPSLVTDEEIINTAALYWLTGTIHTSVLPYKESDGLLQRVGTDPRFAARGTPMGFSYFRYELASPPLKWLKAWAKDLVWHRRHEHGGHFAALDNPVALVGDLRDFFGEHFRAGP